LLKTPQGEGYRGSRLVRVGNAAYQQLQMNIYGELIEAVYLYNKYGNPISSEVWRDVRRLVEWVADNWRRKDNGIWEVRSEPQHFVYSKLMCWVALVACGWRRSARFRPMAIDGGGSR